MKDFTEILNENVRHERLEYSGHRLAYPLELADGTILSVQASTSHYCEPRETTPRANYNWYEEFEIGFPTKVIAKLIPYAEDDSDPTNTVYGFVPKALIREVVEDCGGVVGVFKGEYR